MPPPDLPNKGFTLAELLLALLTLAVIATFTIPKILTAAGSAQKKAVFRETIAALDNYFYSAKFYHSKTTSQASSDFLNSLNAYKICTSDSEAEGCWTAPSSAHFQFGTDKPGAVLHNGMVIVKSYTGTDMISMILDWNGSEGSNTVGDDQICLVACFMNVRCKYGVSHSASWGNRDTPIGLTGIPHNQCIGSSTFYQEIFAN